MQIDEHFPFIFGAYLVAVGLLLGLMLYAYLSHKRAKRALEKLDDESQN